jgi:hypothetical protein
MRTIVTGKEVEKLVNNFPSYEIVMVQAQDLNKDEMPKGFEINHNNGILYIVVG